MDKVNIEVIEQSFTELFNQKFGAPLNVRGDNILLNTQFSSKVREFVLSFFKPYLKTNEQLQQEKEQYLDEFEVFLQNESKRLGYPVSTEEIESMRGLMEQFKKETK